MITAATAAVTAQPSQVAGDPPYPKVFGRNQVATGLERMATLRKNRRGASVARCSPNRRFLLLLPGAVPTALSASVTKSRRISCYAAIANASLSLAFRCFETFNGLFMPGKSSRLSTHVDPGSAPHNPRQPGVIWWSRRVLPPGPLHLFHDAIYRHRRAEARRDRYRRLSAGVQRVMTKRRVRHGRTPFRRRPGSRDSASARRR